MKRKYSLSISLTGFCDIAFSYIHPSPFRLYPTLINFGLIRKATKIRTLSAKMKVEVRSTIFEVYKPFIFVFSQKDYESIYSDYASQLIDKYSSTGLVHTGSWKVHIGSVQNQYVHIWMYKNYAHLDTFIDQSKSNLNNNKLNEHILGRSNQICLSFSYFGKENFLLIIKY